MSLLWHLVSLLCVLLCSSTVKVQQRKGLKAPSSIRDNGVEICRKALHKCALHYERCLPLGFASLVCRRRRRLPANQDKQEVEGEATTTCKREGVSTPTGTEQGPCTCTK